VGDRMVGTLVDHCAQVLEALFVVPCLDFDHT
jgi:hypothetical protein